jgi:hypothetical protein
MLKIIKNMTVKLIDNFENMINSAGNKYTDRKEFKIPGFDLSAPIDVFNQQGKRKQSGLLQIDWDEETNKRDD